MTSKSTETLLELRHLVKRYGGLVATDNLDLTVTRGEIHAIIGPNGAGKTTLIHQISGAIAPTSGTVLFNGRDITQLESHRFCEAGIAIVPEGRRLFTQMTVYDNLELGSYIAPAKAKRQETLEYVLSLFPALKVKLQSPAGALSGGQQQMVAIGRALMARPSLLLMDEPSLGLAPAIVLDMFGAIRKINAQGTSVLLVEQNVAMAMALAHRAYVMEEGRIVAEGLASELLTRPEIQKAY